MLRLLESCKLLEMFLAELDIRKLRLGSDPLVRAFAYSLLFHFCLFGTLEIGIRLGIWNSKLLPSWLSPTKNLQSLIDLQSKQAQNKLTSEPPLLFVQVEPEQSAAEAPKDAKYYAAVNSVATNPKQDRESKEPKIDGTQTKMIKTADIPKQKPVEKIPEPAPEPAPPKKTIEPDVLQPLPKKEKGDTDQEPPEKSADNSTPSVGTESTPKQTRPRSVAEAMMRKGLTPGEKTSKRVALKGVHP